MVVRSSANLPIGGNVFIENGLLRIPSRVVASKLPSGIESKKLLKIASIVWQGGGVVGVESSAMLCWSLPSDNGNNGASISFGSSMRPHSTSRRVSSSRAWRSSASRPYFVRSARLYRSPWNQKTTWKLPLGVVSSEAMTASPSSRQPSCRRAGITSDANAMQTHRYPKNAPRHPAQERTKDLERFALSPFVVSSRNGGRTRTARKGHRILSPVRLPIPPSGQLLEALMLLLRSSRDNGRFSAVSLY